MCSSSEIGVDSLSIGLNLVSKLVENFEGGFTTYENEFSLLEEGVLVINRSLHGG